jgi:hypothetical protein
MSGSAVEHGETIGVDGEGLDIVTVEVLFIISISIFVNYFCVITHDSVFVWTQRACNSRPEASNQKTSPVSATDSPLSLSGTFGVAMTI